MTRAILGPKSIKMCHPADDVRTGDVHTAPHRASVRLPAFVEGAEEQRTVSDESLYKLFLDYYVLDLVADVRVYRTGGGRLHFLHRGHQGVRAEVPQPR